VTEEQTQRTPPAGGPRVISGRYALLGEIGRGGMGVVWRAQDQVIGRQVALKELRLPEGAEDAGVFQERVLREVRTGGRLNDPAVVTVYDVVHENGSTYIVMELVEAPTLSDLVRRTGPLPAWQVAAIGEQVLSALKSAHEAGIVHRDVKPGNVMVAPNGRVKLTDFGIAQAIDDPRLTTSGMIIGSPAFMAPERVEGREAMPASDLWSLGATLFFAVEGSVAFERPTTAATLHAIMTEVPYLTRGQGPLASAIMGLLISSPEARISADQARVLLGVAKTANGRATPPGGQPAVYNGQPSTRHVTGPSPAMTSKPKRAWWLSAVAALVVAALVGGLFIGKALSAPRADPAMLAALTYGINGQITLDQESSYACYNAPLQDHAILSSGVGTDCDKTHLIEIYDSVDLLGDSSTLGDDDVQVTYPGQDAAQRFAESRCAAGFHTSLVPDDRHDGINFRALIPTQPEWERIPAQYKPLSRNIYCALTKQGNTQLYSQIHAKIK
jgi:tRNA A-37 threonylcarbamoyl transferase component Bud32